MSIILWWLRCANSWWPNRPKFQLCRKFFGATIRTSRPNGPTWPNCETRLQAEVGRLQESVKADYEAANRTENLLNDSFTAQKGQMVKLQDNLADFQILKRDAQTNEQLYQALLARVKEASIAGTMVPSNIAVIDPGRLPNKPFKPKTMRDLALAAVLGLTFGVGLAFLLEHLDDSIKSLE